VTYVKQCLSLGPAAYWRLDETTGTSFADIGPGAYTATQVTAPTLNVTSALGDGSKALTGGAAQVASLAGPNPNDVMTIVFWFKGTDAASQFSQIGPSRSNFAAGSSRRGWVIDKRTANDVPSGSNGTLGIRLDTSAGNDMAVKTTALVWDNAWHHCVCAVNNGTVKWYIDGALAGSGSYSHGTGFADATSNLQVWAATTYNNSLDEIAIFTRELTAAEVTTLYGTRAIASSQQGGWSVRVNTTGQVVFDLWGASAQLFGVTTTARYDDNVWHHFACTWDGLVDGTATVYMDGAQVAQVSGSSQWITHAAPIGNALPTMLGAGYSSSALASGFFSGALDEIAIFDHALTSAEVSSHFYGTAATDSGNFLQHGLYHGDITLQQAGVLADGNLAVNFGGTSSYVEVPNVPGPWPTRFGLEAFIRPSSIGTDNVIFGNSANANNFFGLHNGKLRLSLVINGVTQVVDGSTTLVTGQTYHVFGGFDGTAMKLYVNGVLDGNLTGLTGTLSFASSPVTLYIGQLNNSTPKRFAGLIDELAFYDHALPPSEVAAHYNARTITLTYDISSLF
jgi:hypothetical protein